MQSGNEQADFTARVTAVAGRGVLNKSAMRIPGSTDVIGDLLRSGRYRSALEIGTYRGVTAAYMATLCERVTTIDLLRGRMEIKQQPFDRRAFWGQLGFHNIDLHLVADDTEKAALVAGLDFDFAFIDGNHTAPAPANDFGMVRRCGTVLFHDYGDDNGVTKFVNTLPKRQVTVTDIFALWKDDGPN